MIDSASSAAPARVFRAARAAATVFAASLLFNVGLFATDALAQDQTPFGGFKHDANQPIEVAADTLEVRNVDQVAIFRGAVDVRQGDVRMRAKELEVRYKNGGGAAKATAAGSGPSAGAIEHLRAEGDVIISNGKETAKSNIADYNVAGGEILLIGDVMLVQGQNVIKGEQLRIDLATGTARMEGADQKPRIRMKLDPAAAKEAQ